MAEALCRSPEILVCKMVQGKVTYVHRRLWAARVKLAARFQPEPLAKTWNEHTPGGSHHSRQLAFPGWVPGEVVEEAGRLSVAEAERILAPWLSLAGGSLRRPSR